MSCLRAGKVSLSRERQRRASGSSVAVQRPQEMLTSLWLPTIGRSWLVSRESVPRY